MARTRKTQIKQDLIDQLERRGVYGQHYLDLVEDYMALWEVKRALIKDIKHRGVVVEYQNGRNQWGTKKMPARPFVPVTGEYGGELTPTAKAEKRMRRAGEAAWRDKAREAGF